MNLRLPAQWEHQDSIIVVFPTNHTDWQYCIEEIQKSYVTFINAIREFQKCIVICDDEKIIKHFFSELENIQIINITTNDTWIRDFGAIDFFQDNKLHSYNFIFNAWGNKFESKRDNDFNAKFQKKNLVNVDFILEGGSIDTNGKGTLLTTSKCIFNKNRNDRYNKEEITYKLKKLFGLNQLIILNHGALKGDDTDSHIDTLARFINENTIAYVKCYDENDIHFEELNLMEQELQKNPFKLVPLPLPKAKYFGKQRLPATYLNFIFINQALILPTYNDSNDNKVVKILQKELPNRVIKPVDASIFIREGGSLHCSSINKIANNMLP